MCGPSSGPSYGGNPLDSPMYSNLKTSLTPAGPVDRGPSDSPIYSNLKASLTPTAPVDLGPSNSPIYTRLKNTFGAAPAQGVAQGQGAAPSVGAVFTNAPSAGSGRMVR